MRWMDSGPGHRQLENLADNTKMERKYFRLVSYWRGNRGTGIDKYIYTPRERRLIDR